MAINNTGIEILQNWNWTVRTQVIIELLMGGCSKAMFTYIVIMH